MARRKRDLGRLMDVVGVGAKAPIAMAMGTGLAAQVRAATTTPSAGAVTGVAYTGTAGVAAGTAIDIAMKQMKKEMRA